MTDKQEQDTAGVRVKPLEWVETVDDNGRTASAKTKIGNYEVFEFDITLSGTKRTIISWAGTWFISAQRAESYEAGKAAAQADYEQRILSALTTS